MIVIREIHAPKERREINQEWLLIENSGGSPLNTAGLRLTVALPKGFPREVATLDPGFVLKPGEQHRIVSGSPSKKAHGKPPSDKVPNYHLFLKAGHFDRPQIKVRLGRGQHELAQAVFDPKAPSGLGAQ